MSSDNEITALLCSGITFPKMIAPIIFVSILISLSCLYLHDRIVPFTRFRSRQITRFISIGRPEGFLEPGTFIKRFQPHVLFIGEMKRDIMRRVHVYQPEEGGATRAVFAQEARVLPGHDENSIRLNLYNGTVNEPNPNEPGSFFRILFDEYIITLRIAEDMLPDIERRTREMSINELKEQIKELESKSIDPSPLITQIQWKLSLSFACIPLVLIAIPIGIKIKKSEKFIAFGISIAIILAYYILFLAAYMLSTQGKILPYFLWTPNVIFTVIGIWLMSRINK
jgi:lipopolysaccharide export LptBFGC system permease protein LptF